METMSIDNILDFAIEREYVSVAFYASMAANMESELLHGIFQALSGEEQVHVQMLEDVRSRGVPLGNTSVEIGDAVSDYPASSAMAVAAALSLAAMREKQAFKLYFSMSQKALDEGTKAVFLELAKQEACHKLQIEMVMDGKK